jgi:predicted PurR-regulated permease PerM
MSVLVMAHVLGVLGLVVAVPFLAATIVVIRHVLLAQIYGQYDPHTVPPAVLVSTTGERRVVMVPP